MKYFLNGVWANDETIGILPAGAALLTDEQWGNRQAPPAGYVPPAPKAIDQIRALEAAAADATARGNRLVALEASIDIAVRKASEGGLTFTRAQALAWLLVNDANYKKLYDLEQAVRPLRALVV